MLCLGKSIAALVGEIATFKQSLRVKENQKKGYDSSNTVAQCLGFMVREAAWSHSKGGDLLWRKLQLGCLLGAEVRYFLDHFFVLVKGRWWTWWAVYAGEEGWATIHVGHDRLVIQPSKPEPRLRMTA